jgi:hypothetical protein
VLSTWPRSGPLTIKCQSISAVRSKRLTFYNRKSDKKMFLPHLETRSLHSLLRAFPIDSGGNKNMLVKPLLSSFQNVLHLLLKIFLEFSKNPRSRPLVQIFQKTLSQTSCLTSYLKPFPPPNSETKISVCYTNCKEFIPTFRSPCRFF